MNLEIEVKTNIDSRIDSYLSGELDISRSKVQKLIKEDKVLVNDKKVSSSYLVKLGDVISVLDDLDYSMSVEAEDIFIDVVYEDDYLLVINKASGMVVHPAPGHYSGTLVNALLYRFEISGGEKYRPGIVHRLDKDTSGLMLVAKNEKIHDALSKMIANKEVERHYLAIVDGVIKHDTGTIDAPIGRDPNNRQKMAVTDVHGKEAIWLILDILLVMTLCMEEVKVQNLDRCYILKVFVLFILKLAKRCILKLNLLKSS